MAKDKFVAEENKVTRGRGRFIDLLEPRAVKNDPKGKRRFSLLVLLNPDDKSHMKSWDHLKSQVYAAVDDLYHGTRQWQEFVEARRGDDPSKGPQLPRFMEQITFMGWGGDVTDKEGKVWTGFEDRYFIKAYLNEFDSKDRPNKPIIMSTKRRADGKGYEVLPDNQVNEVCYEGSHFNLASRVFIPEKYPKQVANAFISCMALGYGDRIGGTNGERVWDDFDADDYEDLDSGRMSGRGGNSL